MTLERGEFERGGKTTGKNIEVTVQVLDNEGKLLEVRVFFSPGQLSKMVCLVDIKLKYHYGILKLSTIVFSMFYFLSLFKSV